MKDKFIKLLKSIDIDLLDIEYHPKEYLKHLTKNIEYYVSIYDKIIKNCINISRQNKEDIALIDYGCGNGVLGLYARFIGVKEVYFLDINNSFLTAAVKLSEILNLKIKSAICGDISNFPKFDFQDKTVILIGSDVIEHIYDLNIFFNHLNSISKNIFTCFTTGSNPSNWFKVKRLKKMQIKDECFYGSKEDEKLFGYDECVPFYEVRKQIIMEHFKTISSDNINELAKRTRGKIEKDIIIETKLFLETNVYPKELENKTNTCNPKTGSWTERVLQIEEYKSIYINNGFSICFENGFYNSVNNSKIKNSILKVINSIIKYNSNIGKYIAPSITIYGYKNTL